MVGFHWIRKGTLLAVMVCGTGGAGAQAIIDGIRTCKNAYTREQEIALGNKVAAEIYQQQPVLKDSDPVTQYVRRIGEKLVASSADPGWPYNFHVVASDELNAFALPGGSVFVNVATLRVAENEAQLVGVMAHEISHVVLRHATCNISRQQKRSLLYGLGQVVAGAALGGAAGSLASSGIGYVASLNFLSMSRDSESEADRMGVQLMYDAGYDARGMPQFFETIQAKSSAGGAQFLSDHPNPGNRIQAVNAQIDRLGDPRKGVRTTADFNSIQTQAKAKKTLSTKEMAAGEWRKSGDYAKGPMP